MLWPKAIGGIGVEQAEQGSGDPVVVEESRLAGAKPQDRRAEGCRPLAEGVYGLSVQHQVAERDAERDRRCELHAAVVVGNVAVEEHGHREAFEEVVEDRHGAKQLGTQLERLAVFPSRCGRILPAVQRRT